MNISLAVRPIVDLRIDDGLEKRHAQKHWRLPRNSIHVDLHDFNRHHLVKQRLPLLFDAPHDPWEVQSEQVECETTVDCTL